MDNTNKIKLSRNLLLENLHNLPKQAENQRWELSYDPELDNLYYTPKKIPQDARLISMNDEIAFYVTPDSKINGVFIEYLTANFLQHQKEYKPMLKLFSKTTGIVKKAARKKGEEEIYKKALIAHILQNSPT